MRPQIISFNCVLKNATGQLIRSSFNRDVLTSIPGDESHLRGLARGLQQIKKGERRSIRLRADEAYGSHDPKKVILCPLRKISVVTGVRRGQTVSILSKTGVLRFYRVLQIHGDMISLDGNHPLAGQDLVFEIETTDAREATSAEIESAQNMVSSQELHE